MESIKSLNFQKSGIKRMEDKKERTKVAIENSNKYSRYEPRGISNHLHVNVLNAPIEKQRHRVERKRRPNCMLSSRNPL